MSVIKWVLALWLVSGSILVGIAFKRQPGTHTRTFCAYGKVFVEFEDNNRTWGTMLLNNNGKPIACDEEEIISKNTKEII